MLQKRHRKPTVSYATGVHLFSDFTINFCNRDSESASTGEGWDLEIPRTEGEKRKSFELNEKFVIILQVNQTCVRWRGLL